MRTLIKVVHVITDLNVGGAGTYLINYAGCHDRKKISLYVILPKGAALAPLLKKAGVVVIEADMVGDSSASLRAVRLINKLLRGIQPDIVHTHGSFSGRVAGRLCGAKVVFTKHTLNETRQGTKAALMKTADNLFCDVAIGVSQAACRNLLENGIIPKKIKLIYNGTAPMKRMTDAEKANIQKAFSLKTGDKVFAIVARLEKIKDHETFLKAARLCANICGNARFLIVGGGSLMDSLLQRAQVLGIADKCIFTGPVVDVCKIYAVADILVLCSIMENMPISICEAMSARVPVVATEVGGVPEVLQNGENGLLVPAGDHEKLAQQMLRLGYDRQLSEKIAAKAYADWLEKYSAQGFCSQLDELYMDLRGAKQ